MFDTIVDIGRTRKCPLALVSIAPRYAASEMSEPLSDTNAVLL
jgi:hypothetical protein